MRIEIRQDRVLIDGYVNAVGRDSRPITDRNTNQRFVEQIVPGTFHRALQHNEVDLLLDHDETRKLGSTATNLELYEDSIGLRAHVEITDAEVIQKAREKKLRGWSFGFIPRGGHEETMANGMIRRFVDDMELREVSLVDERKLPCYEGTSIEVRAGTDQVLAKPDPLEIRAVYVDDTRDTIPDYSDYKNRIKALEE